MTCLLLACGQPTLDFASGWDGSGFAPDAGSMSSAAGATGLLHRTFRLPADAAFVRFTAAVTRAAPPKGTLDVVLEVPGREFLPTLTEGGRPAAVGPHGEYHWRVERHAGKTVRIALVDDDPRPGCHLVCSAFEVLSRDGWMVRRFEKDMRAVTPRARRHDSKHFVALGDAGPAFTEARLRDCEAMYAAFFRHFRRKGFDVREPGERLMVAVFAAQGGFDAYVGRPLGSHVTGLYHTPTNRLAVYDYATNGWFLHSRREADRAAAAGSDLERRGTRAAADRFLRDRREDVNVSTMMHETAHLLSFNAGLLERGGDVPAWLAEGLAVYCESTSSGSWQGVGEPNPQRAASLRGRPVPPLRALVDGDGWLKTDAAAGYAASGLLFRMLMEERPRQLRAYLDAVRGRRGPEGRRADFAAAFGDLSRRYDEYVAAAVRSAR